jgi:hypothetical protein
MWVACMKREMKLMIVSGYQLYKLYRLIKIRTIHSFFKNRTTHRTSWALGILKKYEQSHGSLWPHDFCGQELSWADTGSEVRDQPPDGSPSCQYKSWSTKNFVNRGTKKTPAPPSLVTKKWIQELLLPQASAWRQATHQESAWGRRCRHPRPLSPRRRSRPRPLGLRRCTATARRARGGTAAPARRARGGAPAPARGSEAAEAAPTQGGAAARGAPVCSNSSLFRCLFFNEDVLWGLAQSWKPVRSSRGPTTPWSAADDRDGLRLQGQCLGWVPRKRSGPPVYDDDGGLDVSSSSSDSDSDSDGGAPPTATTSA